MVDSRIQNARAFCPRASVDESVEAVVTDVAKEILLGGKQKRLNHLKYLLLDLRNRQLETPQGYLYCSRSHDSYQFYQVIEPYKSLEVSPDPFIGVLDKLKAYEFIIQDKGFMGDAAYQTRIKPTPALIPYLNRIPESVVGYQRGVAQEIELRKKIYLTTKGKLATKRIYLKFEITQDIKNLAGFVRFINRHFSEHHIDIYQPEYNLRFDTIGSDGIKETAININLNKKYLNRIFNDDFESGGRFYGGWWQSIPSELRRYILIDGVSTVEVDFKGFHIALLYSIKGIDYFAQGEHLDPYTVKGWDRDDVKLLLQIVLNTSKKNVIPAFNDERATKGLPQFPKEALEALMVEFERMHAPIVDWFYEGLGKTLQNIDAKIAERVMLSCMKIGARNADGISEQFVALPIHDSFIVKKQHQAMLVEMMKVSVSEVITELNIFEGKVLEQYTPRFKSSTPINIRELPTDSYYHQRKAIYDRNGVLPEIQYYRKSNHDNSINLFRFNPTYNQ